MLLDHDFPLLRHPARDRCLFDDRTDRHRGAAVDLYQRQSLLDARAVCEPPDPGVSGSARTGDRKPDPFTGFDPKDNLRLALTEPQVAGDKLFHVINATLNVVSSKNRAWQERKAESFTMTRLYCGNPYVRYRRTASYGGSDQGRAHARHRHGHFRGRGQPEPGIQLLAADRVSVDVVQRAAGLVVGKPEDGGRPLEGPRLSLSPALRELTGDTTDDSQWIYLSDGGHFENLGLYEMIRQAVPD